MKPALRIVIDTNIWISGLLWKGKPWQLLRLAEVGRVELCISYQMMLELTEVLEYPRLESRLKQLELSPEQLVVFALSISSAFDVSRTGLPIVADDPDDDIFLLTAEVAKAIYVVSSDKHLLNLQRHAEIEIITIDDFMAREFSQ